MNIIGRSLLGLFAAIALPNALAYELRPFTTVHLSAFMQIDTDVRQMARMVVDSKPLTHVWAQKTKSGSSSLKLQTGFDNKDSNRRVLVGDGSKWDENYQYTYPKIFNQQLTLSSSNFDDASIAQAVLFLASLDVIRSIEIDITESKNPKIYNVDYKSPALTQGKTLDRSQLVNLISADGIKMGFAKTMLSKTRYEDLASKIGKDKLEYYGNVIELVSVPQEDFLELLEADEAEQRAKSAEAARAEENLGLFKLYITY